MGVVRVLSVTETTTEGCISRPTDLVIRFDSLANQPTSGCDIDNYPLKVPNVITPNGDSKNDAFS